MTRGGSQSCCTLIARISWCWQHVCALQLRLQISLQFDYCSGATGPFAVTLTQIEMTGRSWFALTPAAAANCSLALDAVDAVLVCPVKAEGFLNYAAWATTTPPASRSSRW